MKLIIFGATGTIGAEVVRQALNQQYRVTAFSRNPEKLQLKHNNLRFISGNVCNKPDVRTAVTNHDAVIVALGAGRKGSIRSEGTRNVIQAMEQSGVNRLVCLSTLGAGESRDNLNFFWKYIMFGFFLRKAYTDHQMQEEYVRNSSLTWTIVRPGAFTDGEQTGKYKHGFSSSEKHLRLKISRADVADFILKQLADDHYHYKSPAISY